MSRQEVQQEVTHRERGDEFVVRGLLNKQVDGELTTSKITVKIQRGKVKAADRVADGTCPHPQKIGLTDWHPEDRS
jgi:FixJ family two-component response regulator